MLKKVSGAKTVIVPITKVGENYLPFIEDLKDKYIKYIDFVPMASLPYSADSSLQTSDNIFISLAVKQGNVYKTNLVPLCRFNVDKNLGVRIPIMDKLSLQNSFLNNSHSANIGKSAVLVFWYDEPFYSARNRTDVLAVDSFEVPILTNSKNSNFPDNRTMVNKRFRNFYLTYPAVTANLKDGITMTQARNIYITFQSGNYAVVDTLPLPLLYQLEMLKTLQFANIIFDFTNSYVTIGGAGTLIGYAGKTVFINAVYENK